MQPAIFSTCLLISSCAWDAPAYVAGHQQIGIASRPDPAAHIVLQCDAMGLKSAEAHRLCILRGVDRLGIQATQPPSISHVPLLAYPYPPLSPNFAVPVVPGAVR